MLLNRVILKYCTEEAGKEAFACARTPRLRLRLQNEHKNIISMY